ncbi:MAG: acetyl-CoA carboxylase biotin carboxyl carrier protein subunit [Bacteroidia bacterium]|nr:acetyl-CoA carboxylase biotin carboxyl carrier protein subunit [Bacteroidia bacterium]
MENIKINDDVLEMVLEEVQVLEQIEYSNFYIDDTKYKTLLTKKFEKRQPWKSPDKSKIITHVPGTIGKILVKEKEKIKPGQKLLVLESMKMKNIVETQDTGVIKRICVTPGQKVSKGEVLIEL